MSMFKDMLGAEERLITNEYALDYEFVPKIMPFRENQQKQIVECIKPLLTDRNGRNLFVYGAPGIGKTAAARWVLRDLEENTEGIVPIYINCWQKNTTFKIFLAICDFLGYKFLQNKKTTELFNIIKKDLNEKAAAFVFDEIDKIEDFEFLYSLLNDLYKKSIILITNNKEILVDMEDRIKSRLSPESLEFKPYTAEETYEILKQRARISIVEGSLTEEALQLIADSSSKRQDIRSGIHLLRESARTAEDASSKKIEITHAEKSISKLESFQIKNSSELEEDTRFILNIIKENSDKKIGDVFNAYKSKGGVSAYKTFQRKVEKLNKLGFITANKICGKEGNTTILSVSKKLSEF
ncbi:AAA family ATPase [Candidatus Woesearchaeota archaeon]|nr:AAA family ATPase [Candidatus Woesearchaeota archaeon]